MNFLHHIPARALISFSAAILCYLNPLKSTAADGFEAVRDGFSSQGVGGTKCTFEYEPSGSTWTQGLDESKVFLAAFASGDWRLGIGKGGQIYSLRGPFGESIPPQRPNAPWIDEVWHLVVTNNDIVTPIHDFQNSDRKNNWMLGMPIQYFIHQAGIYLEGLTGTKETGAPVEPFYSPLLASQWDPATSSLYLLNWAQQARSPNVWKSGVLIQTGYRDIGGGAIEVVQLLSNFGSEKITYMNAPWGGVRHSSLPHTVLSEKGGGWKKVEGSWGWEGIPSAPFNETGGWIGWARDSSNEASPTLGLVFGVEGGKRPDWRKGRSQILYGTAAKGSPRDYDAVETSCSINLPHGESLMVRWFLVIGPFAHVRERAVALSGNAAMWQPAMKRSALKPVWIDSNDLSNAGKGDPDFHLYALPVAGAVPVFLMKDSSTGACFAATDPSAGVPKAPLRNPIPASNPLHAVYENREVHYQYQSNVLPTALLGFASLKETEGTSRIELPGAGGASLVVWGPAKVESVVSK